MAENETLRDWKWVPLLVVCAVPLLVGTYGSGQICAGVGGLWLSLGGFPSLLCGLLSLHSPAGSSLGWKCGWLWCMGSWVYCALRRLLGLPVAWACTWCCCNPPSELPKATNDKPTNTLYTQSHSHQTHTNFMVVLGEHIYSSLSDISKVNACISHAQYFVYSLSWLPAPVLV